MIRKGLIFSYIATVMVLALATIVEKANGTSFVQQYWYGSWWFTLLWTILVAFSVAWMVRCRMRRWQLVLLHASFVVILAGALLTKLTGSKGVMHLRQHKVTDVYIAKGSDGGETERHLPFQVRLDRFDVSYHEGTDAASDYQSQLTIVDGDNKRGGVVAMNKILSYRNYRFYQSGFDEDMRGTVLSVNSDPYGIPVTYVGYALLFFSLIYMLIDPKGTFRQLLRTLNAHTETPSPLRSLVVIFILSASSVAQAVPTVPRESADKFGRLYILYNNRICPVQTYALDFTKKLCGKRSYNGLSAEQVLLGFIFWGDEWNKEPVLKIKNGEAKTRLGWDSQLAPSYFFNKAMGGYILAPYVQEYYNGNSDGLHKQVAQIDEKLMLIMELRQGLSLKMFPTKAGATWVAPVENEGTKSESGEQFFSTLYRDALSADWHHFDGVVDDIAKFQQTYGGASLPTNMQGTAERIYNNVPFATILFMSNLTLGFLMLFWMIVRMTRPVRRTWESALFAILNVLAWLALTACMVLRWIASGDVPVSNGYETMLFLAWLVMLISIIGYVRTSRHVDSEGNILTVGNLLVLFSFLLSGFFLLVSHISQMDPKIGHMMPVLNSPLLTIHVSIIMMAYALLSITFLCSLTYALLSVLKKKNATEQLYVLSRLFLYPAMTCLGLGIFIGAIWANVSWGEYWSWDPKETWALITLMVYAVPLHGTSLPIMRRPRVYHLYMALAFLTILMTYFGVNYFLGGMHSYA